MTNLWNTNKVITPVTEYLLVYQYQKHRDMVQSINNQPLSQEKPFIKKKQKQAKSAKLDELRHPEFLEQKMLVQKLISLNSQFNKESPENTIPKPSNLGSKILQIRKLIEDNQGIEKRIKETNSVISFDKIKEEYKKNKVYLKNLQSNSRRIYNCFVPKSVTPVANTTDRKKKKKKTQQQKIRQQLKLMEQNSKHIENNTKQSSSSQSEFMDQPIKIEIPAKDKTYVDQEKLAYELDEITQQEKKIAEQSD